MKHQTIEERVRARLATGPATFNELHAAIPHGYRELDRTLQRMRRRGEVVSLPRIRGERQFPLWASASPETPTRETTR